MNYYKFLLTMLVVFLLSGSFSLPIGGIIIEARYIILFIILLALLIPVKKASKQQMEKELSVFLGVNTIFSGLLIFTSFYSINQEKSLIGSLDIILIALSCIVLVYTLKNKQLKNHLEYLTWLWVIVGAVFFLPILLSISSGSLRGQSLAGPNVSTRIMFFAFGSSWFYWACKRQIKFAILGLMFLAGIILLGSRGGVVAAFGTIAVLYLFKIEPLRVKRPLTINLKKIALILASVPVGLALYKPVTKVVTERVIGATFRDNGEIYTSGRDFIYELAINLIKEKPIMGHGINTFSNFIPEIGYPHNLALELMYSMGLLGIAYFLVLVYYSLKIIVDYRNSDYYVLSGFPLYMIMVQMFSGGIYDFRYYFFWIIILLYYKGIGKHKYNLDSELLMQTAR